VRVGFSLLAVTACVTAFALSSAASAYSDDGAGGLARFEQDTFAEQSFGQFAGYVWLGHVTSVRASWSVPRIALGSFGLAGTWIGAEARGAFIQIGTNEESFRPWELAPLEQGYQAFWSDPAHHFRAQRLFSVHPGDHMSASLTLADRRWTLVIIDKTIGRAAHFSTRDEADASFNRADWLQEDPGTKSHAAPYPRLTAVRFAHLKVNATAPDYSGLYSQWMSVNGRNWAPTPLSHDSFSLRPATLSPFGARYLAIAAPEDAATITFIGQMGEWAPTTSPAQIASEASTFTTALRNDIHVLAAVHWPGRGRRLVRSLIRRTGVLLAYTETAVPESLTARRQWIAIWARDAGAIGRAGHAIRRFLRVPETT
jgi:hypothetical protein